MISVRSLQRSAGDVTDPMKYICSESGSLDESIQPCPSVRTPKKKSSSICHYLGVNVILLSVKKP